jgi:hypothetical protein
MLTGPLYDRRRREEVGVARGCVQSILSCLGWRSGRLRLTLRATGSLSGRPCGAEADDVVAGSAGHGLEEHPVVVDVEQLGVDPDG